MAESTLTVLLPDALFGRESFLNEIIWAYDYGARSKNKWPAKHDNILVYVKNPAKLTGFLSSTRSGLQNAPVAHFDEAGGRVAGKLWWIHVACTDQSTLYHLASGRGKESMDAGGVLPDFTGVAVHDGLAAYRRYDVPHALCAAH